MKKIVTMCAAVILLATSFEAAAAKDSKEHKELHRLQLQLQAAQQDKGALSDQLDALKKQLDDMKSVADKASHARVALENLIAEEKLKNTALTGKNQETDDKLQQESKKNADAAAALQKLQVEKDEEKKRLDAEIAKQIDVTQTCEKKNAELYQIDLSLMEKYKDKGVFTSLLQKEPFTQIESVKIENLLQEYRDKADAAKM